MAAYSLCRRLRGNKGRWERVPGTKAYTLAVARSVFQDRLLANAFGQIDPDHEYRLRPVARETSHAS